MYDHGVKDFFQESLMTYTCKNVITNIVFSLYSVNHCAVYICQLSLLILKFSSKNKFLEYNQQSFQLVQKDEMSWDKKLVEHDGQVKYHIHICGTCGYLPSHSQFDPSCILHVTLKLIYTLQSDGSARVDQRTDANDWKEEENQLELS